MILRVTSTFDFVLFPGALSRAASKNNMGHVSPTALWTYGCRVHALSDVELEHVLSCIECDRLLDEIEEALNEIAGGRDQTIN